MTIKATICSQVLKDMPIEELKQFCMNPKTFHQIKHSTAFKVLVDRLEGAEAKANFAYPTIEDYKACVKFEPNEAFILGWDMARTTNGLLDQLRKNSEEPK